MNQFAGNPFAGMTSGDQSSGTRYPFLGGGGDNEDPIEGDYKLLIKRVALRGRQKPYYVVEVLIEESNQPQRPVGMMCSCFTDATNVDMRGKNICGFLSAAFGVDPTTLEKDSLTTPWDGQAWADYVPWSYSDENPLAERRVGCRVQTTTTKAGNPFSVHNWVPYDMMIVPARTFAQPRQAPAQQGIPQTGFGQTGAFAPPPPPSQISGGGAAGPGPSFAAPAPAQNTGGFKPGGFKGGSWGGPQR